MAGVFPLAIIAGVVIVRLAAAALAAVTVHLCAAVAAEQFPGQQKRHLRFALRRRRRVREPALHSVPKLFVDDGGDGIFGLVRAVLVYADVALIVEHRFKAAAVERSPLAGTVAAGVELLCNGRDGMPGGVHFKRLLDDGRGRGVDDQTAVLDVVAKRNRAAGGKVLLCCLFHTAGDFLRKLR